ncbi:MAG: molybdopterin molybdotransferase MoeA [Acidobacteriota bacterium]
MISFSEAVAAIIAQKAEWGSETVPLEEAAGRVLNEEIAADRDYPPFNRATMDGYAVRTADILEKGIRQFRVVGEIFAGSGDTIAVGSGEAVKIMTGAPVPDTADAVIRREDAVEERGMVTFHIDEFKWHQSIAKKGEDISSGRVVMSKPVRIGPAQLAVLSSLGRRTVRVMRLPRVALCSTGNEIRPIGAEVAPFQIRDANRYSIEGFLRQHLIRPVSAQIVPDEPEALTRTIAPLLEEDLVIITGGVSAGDADFVPAALQSCGVKELFHKVKIRPGKPLWFGMHEGGARVMALPGNPFSVQVGCRLFIEPLLRASFRLPQAEPITIPLGSMRKKRTHLDEFFPARLSHEGSVSVEHLLYNTSGDITAALDTDGIVRHPAAAGDLAKQEAVQMYLWQPLR